MSASGNTGDEQTAPIGDASQFNELKQMIASLDKRIQGTDRHVQVGFKETKREMALMHGKVSVLHEGSARKEMAGRHGKLFARPLLINHSYSLVKHFVECGVVKADTIEELRSHETIIIQACLPQTQPFMYVNLLVERVQQYVKDSPRLFLNTTFRDKGIMGPPGKATNHFSFFRDDKRANPTALRILADWIRNYNAVLRYLSLESLIVEGVVSSEGLRTALLALRKDGLASEEGAGVEKLSKTERLARNELQGRQGASKPLAGTPAAMWKAIEEALKKNEFLVDFNVALNERPVTVNEEDGSVDADSLLAFLGLVTERLKQLTDGVMNKSRVLGEFLKKCEESVKADTSKVDSSNNGRTEEEAAKAELEKLSKAASAMLATPTFGPVFIMVLACAAQHDAALLRLGGGMGAEDAEEEVKRQLPKDLPPQELEIDLGGKITYRDGRLYVSAGEVKSGEKGVKPQAKAQLRIRTLVLGYAAKCLLVAKGQLVQKVEREGVIVTRKKIRTAGEADSDSDAASNGEETEQDRNDGIIFIMEHL